jgi:hypothetical protein
MVCRILQRVKECTGCSFLLTSFVGDGVFGVDVARARLAAHWLGRLAGLRPCGDILVWISFGLGVGVCWLVRDA